MMLTTEHTLMRDASRVSLKLSSVRVAATTVVKALEFS